MEIRHYAAVVYRGSDGYGVVFPDIPGCTTHGYSIHDAAMHAEEALTGHIELMVRDGDPLPDPTTLDRLDEVLPESEPDDEPEITRFLVRAEIPARWIRVNLSMAENLVTQIDQAAKQIGMTRSGYMAEGARRMLAGQ
ncbi:MAG: type II toxin-antitoxin system HicB family antitoxin [Magnetococcales bacterium]|nr:type II toxin-antitoxin system HicB family antitoxin [Magnetococcales bacterium]